MNKLISTVLINHKKRHSLFAAVVLITALVIPFAAPTGVVAAEITSGDTTGTVASSPAPTGGASEYAFSLRITSSAVSGITAGQLVWCAAKTTDFPNLLTVGAALTGTLDNSPGWWVFKKSSTPPPTPTPIPTPTPTPTPPLETGNTIGTVASTPFSTGWPNEYNLYLKITSTTVSGLVVGQRVWCAASTTDFPNLLTMGASLSGNLDSSLGWWVFKSVSIPAPDPEVKTLTINIIGQRAIYQGEDELPITYVTNTTNTTPFGFANFNSTRGFYTGTVTTGSSVTLRVSPTQVLNFNPTGIRFMGWSGDVTSADSTITLVMDSDKSITVTWQVYTYVGTAYIGVPWPDLPLAERIAKYQALITEYEFNMAGLAGWGDTSTMMEANQLAQYRHQLEVLLAQQLALPINPPPPPATGNTIGTVASMPFPTGWANEYNLYLNITSTTVPGIIVGQQVLCAASTTDFPNLLTVGATLTGTLDNSLGWWVFKSDAVVTPPPPPPPPATGNTIGTVASTPFPTGWPDEYNLYLNITSTTVSGLIVGQQVLCAASTTDFPNLLTVGATLTGTLDNSLGWWVLKKI